jgi:hypothetical protein
LRLRLYLLFTNLLFTNFGLIIFSLAKPVDTPLIRIALTATHQVMAIAIMVPSDSLASQVRPTVCPIPDKREGYDCSRATHGNQTIIQRTFLDITEPEMAMARSRTMRRIKKISLSLGKFRRQHRGLMIRHVAPNPIRDNE